jgi:hypothetical protein
MMNFEKSYGIIFGHDWARYEQNGTLYDAQGRSYDESSTDRAENEEFRSDPLTNVQNAREWLEEQLKGGPVQRENLFKKAEQEGIKWDSVKVAATEIKVVANKVRDNIIWRLRLE